MIERDYRITPITMSFGDTFKVEVWNDFGMKKTVYERNVIDASRVIMDWWENSDEEFEKRKSLRLAILEMIEIDRSSGITKNNRDNLD
tara:strand:- start:186 stop:449 length:264 start_codon:yes stop_codon:yes gene_type:complete